MTTRLTLVVNALGAGGAERVLTTLANHWASLGRRVTILTFDQGDQPPFFPLHKDIVHRPLDISTKSRPLPGKLWGVLRAIPRLRTAILESKPGIVVSFMDQANLLCLLAISHRDFPVVVSERVVPFKSSIVQTDKPRMIRWLAPSFRNFLYARADAVVVQTQDIFRYFPSAVRNKIAIIPNPVVINSDAAPDMTLPSPSILGMGRLTAQKRFDLLLAAFARVHKEYPAWKLVIVGSGELLDDLHARAAALGIASHVEFPGSTKTPLAVLKQCELFVLSSDYEGFPGVLLEAMASGRAVIATDCPSGPRDIVTDGVDGMLVPAGDEEKLAGAMRRLLADPSYRQALGAKATEVLQRFELEKIMEMWEQVIAFAIKGRENDRPQGS